ncbi:MAG: hypothetical protein A4E73_02989 [Syntrophaceae bacterium PtaU1.Bin231]|nr:MAG: hypothetical protein A4E73_02989 [Syntrophaceae bacterium PtaU1.Bin231]
MSDTGFLIVWAVSSLLLALSFGLFFLFARHCGMLKDQDRARYLPLWAEVAEKQRVQSAGSGVEHHETEDEKLRS